MQSNPAKLNRLRHHIPDRPNVCWRLDFESDAFTDSRRSRVLDGAEDYKRVYYWRLSISIRTSEGDDEAGTVATAPSDSGT